MSKKINEDVEELLKELATNGWDVVLPFTEDGEPIPGVIMGDQDFIKFVSSAIQYYQANVKPTEILEEIKGKGDSDDDEPTFH